MAWIPDDVGVVLVDHGSKREAANAMLLDVAALFQEQTGAAIVEPAHMELAEPSILAAVRRCKERGARRVVIHPYFLAPGRHSTSDIPRLAQEAEAETGIPCTVTAPLGVDGRITEVALSRIAETLEGA